MIGLLKKKVIVSVLLVLFFGLSYYAIFYNKTCDNKECFSKQIQTCSKTEFVMSGNVTFEYKILGKNDGSCDVRVTLLDGGIVYKDLESIKNQEMTCSVPINFVGLPESDLALCHGRLKEELQTIIINKLHTYVIQNLGNINSEVLQI